MRRVSKAANVPYSADQMYELVADIERYPEFLPGCRDAIVHSRTDSQVEATLEVAKGPLSKSFTTRNHLTPGQSISLELVRGPFQRLGGMWEFRPAADGGSQVSLRLDFEFSSRLLGKVVGPIFEEMANSMVDAFRRRARTVYGAPAPQ